MPTILTIKLNGTDTILKIYTLTVNTEGYHYTVQANYTRTFRNKLKTFLYDVNANDKGVIMFNGNNKIKFRNNNLYVVMNNRRIRLVMTKDDCNNIFSKYIE